MGSQRANSIPRLVAGCKRSCAHGVACSKKALRLVRKWEYGIEARSNRKVRLVTARWMSRSSNRRVRNPVEEVSNSKPSYGDGIRFVS